ncbi:MAG: hypothetical protein ACI8Z1_002531 [Candidatus Azotimanducaceae bacterium]|jgi:hypothetical protein
MVVLGLGVQNLFDSIRLAESSVSQRSATVRQVLDR